MSTNASNIEPRTIECVSTRSCTNFSIRSIRGVIMTLFLRDGAVFLGNVRLVVEF
jgi:hypothetical protein